jgi:ethanolamine utilization cobalamin adenosyltransferase
VHLTKDAVETEPAAAKLFTHLRTFLLLTDIVAFDVFISHYYVTQVAHNTWLTPTQHSQTKSKTGHGKLAMSN